MPGNVNDKKQSLSGSVNSIPGKDLPGHLTVYNMQIQFQDGFIENISVHGKFKGNDTLLTFENAYPIAFSIKKNFQLLP